jgi:hypothetical protein
MKEKGFGPARAVVRLAFSLIILFLPVCTVCAPWTATGLPDQALAMNTVQVFSDESEGAAPAYQGPGVGAVMKHKWNTNYSSQFKVSGLVSESDTTQGDCTFYDDGTFNCYEDEHGIDRNYTGTYVYSGSTGYKIQCFLDGDGLQEYTDMLTRWAEEMASEEGVVISNILLRFTSVKTPTLKISKKTGIPGKAKVTLKGTISAYLDGTYVTKKFTLTSKITFEQAPQQVTLSVQKNGNGSGTVTSSPTGINCGSTCSGTCNPGTTVTLTAAAGSGSTLSGWSGCDSANGNRCTVTMNQSRTVTVTFSGPPNQLPNAPSNLQASAASSSSVSLRWTNNSGNETGFRIERSLSSGSGFAEIATVGAGTTTYNSIGLNASTPYYYRVRAYNSAGSSGYSNTAWATTSAGGICTPGQTRCIAGNIEGVETCNSSGTAWIAGSCPNWSLCSNSACHTICDITSTPAYPTACMVANDDGVNNGEWITYYDNRLAVPTYVTGRSLTDTGSRAEVHNSGQTWPYAWRIGTDDVVALQFKLNQFGLKHPRFGFKAKRTGAFSDRVNNYSVGAFNGENLIGYCIWGPASFQWDRSSCYVGSPVNGNFNYSGGWNGMLLSITGDGFGAPIDHLDVNYVYLSIEP